MSLDQTLVAIIRNQQVEAQSHHQSSVKAKNDVFPRGVRLHYLWLRSNGLATHAMQAVFRLLGGGDPTDRDWVLRYPFIQHQQ